MQRKKVLILLHRDDVAFIYFKYLVKCLIKEWKALGLAVETIRGTDRFVPADIVVPHLDLTVVPEEYRNFLNQYPLVFNRHVRDISKSTISRNLVDRDDPYAGPVIVKTNLNSGGFSEARLIGHRHLLNAVWKRLTLKKSTDFRPGEIPWAEVTRLNSGDYPVFSSLHDVPAAIFDNEHLVIEKFLPEIEGDSYKVRYHHFLGEREFTVVYQSRNKVVKATGAIRHEVVPAPPELHQIRKQLGLEYGKIDYVVRDGNVVLLDVNTTPALPANAQLARSIARNLADGIHSSLHR